MRVDWFSCFRGDGGEAHCFFFFLACVLVLPGRSRFLFFCRAVILPVHGLPGACCRLFRVRLYRMSYLLFLCFACFWRVCRSSLVV